MALLSSQLSTGLWRAVDYELSLVLNLSGLADQRANSKTWPVRPVSPG